MQERIEQKPKGARVELLKNDGYRIWIPKLYSIALVSPILWSYWILFGDVHFDPSEIWRRDQPSTINHQRSGRYTPRKTPTAQFHKEGKNHPISNVLLLSVLWADLSMKKIEKGYPPSKRRPYYKGRCHCLTVARSIKYNRGWYTKNLFFTQRYTNPYKWNGIWNKIHIPTIQVEMSQVTFIPNNINISPCLTQFEDSTLRAVQPEQKLGGETTFK